MLTSPESIFCQAGSDGSVVCTLCPHRCSIKPGKWGICRTRTNAEGRLLNAAYGLFPAVAIDPVEKKPLYHFYPGSRTFSLGCPGCNMACPFCQNSSLATSPAAPRANEDIWPPDAVVTGARKSGCQSVSFTYSEGGLNLEFATDLHQIAPQLPLIFVTNGQFGKGARKELQRVAAAANVDLKAMDAATYKRVLKGDLNAALDTITELRAAGVWVEVTTLVVPDLNDSTTELNNIATFLANLDPDIPWHVSKYHPAGAWAHKTPGDDETVIKAFEIGKTAGLRYVYTGNMWNTPGQKTVCPDCGEILVDRRGFQVHQMLTENGSCNRCNCPIAGIGF